MHYVHVSSFFIRRFVKGADSFVPRPNSRWIQVKIGPGTHCMKMTSGDRQKTLSTWLMVTAYEFYTGDRF